MNVVTPLQSRLPVLGAIVCLGSLVPSAAHAGLLLIGNVAAAPGGDYAEPIGNAQPGDEEVFQGAVTFILPAGPDYILENVILRLHSTQISVPAPVISLHRDDAGGNAPGNALGTLVNPEFTDDFVQDFTFTPSGTVTLSHSTTYWLLVDGGETSSYSWIHGDDWPSQPIAALGSYWFSFDNGANYLSDNELKFVFAINGSDASVVPEPSTAVLMLLSTAGLVPFWWRRQQAT